MKKLIVSLILMFAIPVYATVSADTTKRQFFTASGVGTTYTFTLPVNSEDDISVEKRVTSTGVTTALTRDVDYTIASTGGDYLNGGVVTIAPALADTFEVIVIRDIVQTQETDSGAINTASLELALDKLTRQVQDLRNDFEQRAIKLPESDATTLTTTLGDSVSSANTSIGRDANGNITETVQSETSVSFSSFGTDFVALANAAAARDTLEIDTDDPVEFAAIIGTTGTFSGLITANAGVTLGAGDDLIGSTNSDINMGSGNFTAAGATGDTVVGGTLDVTGVTEMTGVVTIADASVTKTTAAPAADAQISNKKYVDDKGFNADGNQIFSAAMGGANTFQDLDLSSVVGSVPSLVFLEVTAAGSTTYACKPKGFGSATFSKHIAGSSGANGCCVSTYTGSGEFAYFTVQTNSTGVIQHGATNTEAITIKVIGFIGLKP